MNSGKKLLLISFSSIPAADRHSSAITVSARALNRVFETIDIVAIKGEYLAHIERFHGCRLLRVPLVGENTLDRAESFRRAVRRQIESDTYDVIHVRSPLEGLPICEGREEKGYRIVYEAGTFAVQDAAGFRLNDKDLGMLETRLIRDEVTCANQADLVIVRSESALHTLRQRGVKAPIELIPNGVNIDIFDWEVAPDSPIPSLLCMGRLAPFRDVSGVMEALRRVLEIMPIRLRWIGEPEAERRELFKSYAVELGIDKAVSFDPPQEMDDLPFLISAATLCLAPVAPVERYVEWGDQPTGLLEFMACQRPVVAARVAGVEEVVRDGTEALLFTPGDPSGLTSGILFLLRNPRHRNLLAKRGYRRVREQYAESAQRRRVLNVYHEMLGLERRAKPQSSEPKGEEAPNRSTVGLESATQEPITSVMQAAAEESRRIRVESDTRRVMGDNLEEERLETQPNFSIKDTNVDLDEGNGSAWVIPETTPHLKRPTDVMETPMHHISKPVTVEIDDTSKIVFQNSANKPDKKTKD